MRRKPTHGKCHLCGQFGPLTFEHVPPQSAFNDARVMQADIHRLIGVPNLRAELENPKGHYVQGGAGSYTLCSRCNNDTGGWYAGAYVSFVRTVFPLCQNVPSGDRVSFRIRTQPLHILKQVLVMFCSACPPGFAATHPGLVRYLMNKYSREFPQGMRVWAALFDTKNSKATRQSGITSRLDLESATGITYSEISFPPFNFVLTLGGSGPPDDRLTNIDFMRECDYRQFAEVSLSFYNLSVNTYFPGDYRRFDELPK